MGTFSLIAPLILSFGLFILFIVLAINFISAHKRLAVAHEEIARHLANISKNRNN